MAGEAAARQYKMWIFCELRAIIPPMPRILLVDDDRRIREAVEKTVTLEKSFRLDCVSAAKEALPAALKLKPDLILLDIRLGDGDGRHVLKALKENAAARRIPVIFLTGMSGEGDKVLGLNLGADDYLVKPFGALELLARIRAVLRRSGPEAPDGTERIRVGSLLLEPAERRAALDGRELKLQPKEFELLCLLASHPGKALSRAFLIENSSSYGMALRTRSLDTHIKNLRKKLGAKAALIETVPKLGYRFAADG